MSSGESGDDDGETVEATPPRMCVASLSDYNAGRFHGAWLRADVEPEELHEGVQAMHRASPAPGAEEWAIHDFDGFGAVQLSECESLETVASLARGIAEHGPAFAAWAAISDSDVESPDGFEATYRGRWGSADAYADDLLDDLGATEVLEQVLTWLRPYVRLDTAGFARDLQLGGDIHVVDDGDGGVWVFDGHV